ncbi:MAG: argininosuccinate lyase [bacterium]|nr:argininosuccinate lyase [bacterium]
MTSPNIESKPSPLWAKPGAIIERDAMSFMSRDDVLLDRELFLFDIEATKAHVRGLNRIGLMSDEENTQIDAALHDLAEAFRNGSFVLDQRYEDGHTAIESYLYEQLGETGKRVHLGRSRNDQVAVALRLYMKSALEQAANGCKETAIAALKIAREHEFAPMPGYTHLQRAVPSSVGMWMASFAESFSECAHLCNLTRTWIDTSPLGTAAGYGVNIPLPRQQVAEELGFAQIQINPMATQAARGRTEHQVVATLWQIMQETRRLAWDLSLFSSQEFGFVELAAGYVTGSSIMPNKKNPDMAELLRASTAVIAGALSEIQQSMSLPSGYQRDLQLTKGALIRSVNTTLEALSHLPRMIQTMTLDTQRMRSAIDAPMLATDKAVQTASTGLPFRDAYAQAAQKINELERTDQSIDESIHARTSPGACANLMLDQIEQRIRTHSTHPSNQLK